MTLKYAVKMKTCILSSKDQPVFQPSMNENRFLVNEGNMIAEILKLCLCKKINCEACIDPSHTEFKARVDIFMVIKLMVPKEKWLIK